MIIKIHNNADWNIELSNPEVLKNGWWKLSQFYKEQYGIGYLKVDWNIIKDEEIFLGFLHYITDLYFEKIEEGLYQEKRRGN